MITRVWSGWTANGDDADDYERLLRERVLPGLGVLQGFRGANVLRRRAGDEFEFVVLTRFDSLENVRRFAGEDLEAAVIEPEARALLVRFQERVTHYETFLHDR